MLVRFFAHLRDITGCSEADIPYQKTAGALAQSLCDIYGEKIREKIFPKDDGFSEAEFFGPEIIILINGRHVCTIGGLSAPLKPEDRIDVFPVIAGG